MPRRLRALVLALSGILVLSLSPASAASAATSLLPLVDCVSYDAGSAMATAHFGYVNAGGTAQVVPFGVDNQFVPAPSLRGQPTSFVPGIQHDVFSVSWDTSLTPTLTWLLSGNSATASTSSPSCTTGTDVAFAMPASLTTTVGTDALISGTVTDPGAAAGQLGAVTYRLPAEANLGTPVSGSSCRPDPASNSVVCFVPAAGNTDINVRLIKPGVYDVSGAFTPSRDGDPNPTNNTAVTRVRVTDAPVATTGPAGAVTTTGATLTGSVDPAGATTTAQFSYWPAGHADQAVTTAAQGAGDGFGPVTLSAPITGLTPGTAYEFALSAANANGTATGTAASFGTQSAVVMSGLAVTASADSSTVTVGDTFTQTFTVSNAGPDDAPGATLTVRLPDTATGGAATAGTGSCVAASTPSVITCDLGTLPSGASLPVTVTATAQTPGTLTTTAFVAGGDADPTMADNIAVATVTVTPPPLPATDLSAQIVGPRRAEAGHRVSVAILVRNLGPATARAVALTLHGSTGARVESVHAADRGCSTGPVPGCALGSLAPGRTVVAVVSVVPTGVGALTLTASVAADNPDGNLANNTATTTLSVRG